LSHSNAVWADHAFAAAARPRDRCHAPAFEQTPFAIGRAAGSLNEVYERAS
jgi:hypothetical protein